MSRVLILAQIIAEIAVSVFQDYGLAPLGELSQITALTAVRADEYRVVDHFTVLSIPAYSLAIIRQNYVSFRLIRFCQFRVMK